MMPDIHLDIYEKIHIAVSELGSESDSGILQNGVLFLQSMAAFPDMLTVDLYKKDSVKGNASADMHILWPYEQLTDKFIEKYYFHYVDPNNTSDELTNFQAVVSVVIIEGQVLEASETNSYLQAIADNYTVTIVLDYTGQSNLSEKYLRGNIIIRPQQEWPKEGIVEIMDAILSDKQCQDLQNLALLKGTIAFIDKLQREIQFQKQKIAAKKSECEKLTDAIKLNEIRANISNEINDIKSAIQGWTKLNERMLKRKYEEFSRPNIGEFAAFVKTESEGLPPLTETETADKAEKFTTTIDEKFLREFQENIKAKLRTCFDEDRKQVLVSYDKLSLASQTMLGKVGEKNKDSLRANDGNFVFPDRERTLHSYVYFSRMYAGELLKKGMVEYFVALREYANVIMLAVGLLAPLFMISQLGDILPEERHKDNISSFQTENNNGSLEKSGQFVPLKKLLGGLKVFAQITRGVSGLLALGMVIWGIFELRKRIPLKRIEERQKEISKAKENLNSEGRRMISDSIRDWNTALIQWMSDVSENLVYNLEKRKKSYMEASLLKIGQQKTELENLKRSNELLIVKISNAENITKSMLSNYIPLKTELDKKYSVRDSLTPNGNG